MKSGNLNLLENSGPLQAFKGNAYITGYADCLLAGSGWNWLSCANCVYVLSFASITHIREHLMCYSLHILFLDPNSIQIYVQLRINSEVPEWDYRYTSTLSLISSLDQDGRYKRRPGRLNQRIRNGTHFTEGWLCPRT